MEGKRIGIVVGGTGAIPEAAIRMAQEHDVELVRAEDIKQEEYEPTRIPEQVYTIYPRPEIPDITLYDPVSFNSCFVYGFGSTHMWVTEPGRKERLIFVEF